MKDVYTKLKFLRFRDQLDALESDTLAPPVHVRIKPINACNHDCWYCAYHYDDIQLGNLMEYKDVIPRDKMMEIIDDLKEMGVKAVTFSGGGEPLMYAHIEETVEKLGEYGLKVASLTNGSNLKGKVADAFARYGTWIRISIDGWDPESYARYRKVSDKEFGRIIKNMEDFASRGSNCVLGINYIVDKDNYSHVYEFVSLMKEIGVDHVKVMGCIIGNGGAENNQYHEPFRDVVIEQIEKCMALETADFKIIDHYHEFPDRFEKTYTSCPSMQFLTVIGADCKVFTCHDKAYTETGLLGSIENRSFKEFWFSDENKKKMQAINPSIHCDHHCAEHRRNLLLLEYLGVDKEHMEFI